MNDNIAFVGGGTMTRAIAGGLIESGFDATRIFVSEPLEDTRKALERDFPGINASDDNEATAAAADCVVLSVKPQILAAVCRELSDTVQAAKPLIVSIAAGTRSDDIEAWLGGELAVVRVMPNQPSLLRLGASGLFANSHTSDEQRRRAVDIMASVGSVVTVESESEVDAVTAVSGSGPAYFFLLIDIVASTGVDLGLDADAARTLAIETAIGSAALAAAEDESMQALIARVRSPGGTTAAALDSLDRNDVRAIFSAAITAARDRAIELADEASKSET